MAALKIFISHSSRLRDDETSEPQALANWQLLQDVCTALADHYGDQIKILVDYDGLKPSDRWEQCLDEWLYDCHAAVILFSRRAIEQSNWVRKEATILSWRAAVERDFKLFPVLLDDQTAADLDNDAYFCMLGLSREQCVQNAVGAAAIVERVRSRLDDRIALQSTAKTPFEELLAAVEMVIAQDAKEDSLSNLWQKLLPDTPALRTQLNPARRFARGLAHHLFSQGEQALKRFRGVLDGLVPRPSPDRARELLDYVRALWVDVGAAGHIAAGKSHGKCLALNGRLVGAKDDRLDTKCFTLERYLERAWPRTKQITVIRVSQLKTAEQFWQQVLDGYWLGTQRPPESFILSRLREDDRHVVVLLAIPGLSGEAPDIGLLLEIEERARQCKSLVIVVHIGEAMPEHLPADLRPIQPALDCDAEWTQYADEIDARVLINKTYGTAR